MYLDCIKWHYNLIKIGKGTRDETRETREMGIICKPDREKDTKMGIICKMCVGNYIIITGIKQMKNTEPRKAKFGPNLRNFLGDPDQIRKDLPEFCTCTA